MVRRVYAFCLEDEGQDIVEYSLLLAFVVFTLAGLFFSISGSTAGIVSVTNSQITYANSMLH